MTERAMAMSEKYKLDSGKMWVTWRTIDIGITQVSCFSHEVQGPVGVLWCRCYGVGKGGKQRCEVWDCITFGLFRRQGVMTRIVKCLFDDMCIDVILSANKTSLGEKFADSIGVKLDKRIGAFVLTKAAFKKAMKRDTKEESPSGT